MVGSDSSASVVANREASGFGPATVLKVACIGDSDRVRICRKTNLHHEERSRMARRVGSQDPASNSEKTMARREAANTRTIPPVDASEQNNSGGICVFEWPY